MWLQFLLDPASERADASRIHRCLSLLLLRKWKAHECSLFLMLSVTLHCPIVDPQSQVEQIIRDAVPAIPLCCCYRRKLLSRQTILLPSRKLLLPSMQTIFLHILDCRQLVKQLFFKELPQLLHCHPLVHRFSLQYEHKVQALSFCHHEKPPRPYPTGNPHPHAPWGLNSYARCLNTDLYVPRQSPIGGNTAHFKDWCSIL